MTFETISKIVKEFGEYSCLNFRTDDGVVTIIKALKDNLWHYFLEETPNGILGSREYTLVMTSSMEVK